MTRLALLVSLALTVACGGSSSETPPPLEPDPARLLRSPDAAGGASSDAPTGAPPGARSDGSGESGSAGAPPRVIQPIAPRRSGPPASTWGGPTPRRRAPELAPEPQL